MDSITIASIIVAVASAIFAVYIYFQTKNRVSL